MVLQSWFPCHWSLVCIFAGRGSWFTPAQISSQEFHTTEPNPLWGSPPNISVKSWTDWVKFPSTFIIFAWSLSVSTQLSDAGVRSIVPPQNDIIKGVTLSVLVALVCFKYSTSL